MPDGFLVDNRLKSIYHKEKCVQHDWASSYFHGFFTKKYLNREAFPQGSFTEKDFYRRVFYREVFYRERFYREAFYKRSLPQGSFPEDKNYHREDR